MKITLDINELADILSRYLNTTVNEDNISISIDPVPSITVSSVPLTRASAAAVKVPLPKEPPFRPEEKKVSASEDNDDFGAEDPDHTITMEDILNINAAASQNRQILDHPEVTRVLGTYETYEPPPMSEAEVRANRR